MSFEVNQTHVLKGKKWQDSTQHPRNIIPSARSPKKKIDLHATPPKTNHQIPQFQNFQKQNIVLF